MVVSGSLKVVVIKSISVPTPIVVPAATPAPIVNARTDAPIPMPIVVPAPIAAAPNAVIGVPIPTSDVVIESVEEVPTALAGPYAVV